MAALLRASVFMCAGRFRRPGDLAARRPMEKIEVLARERAFFFGVVGMGPQLRDDGLELRDAGGQILLGPGASAAALISSRISRWVV